jgi:ABC-2 type transport system permease protein
LAIARREALLLRRDPGPLVILVMMPLAVMAFVKPAGRILLTSAGNHNATGAEQAVPGVTVLFSFFLVADVSYAFFREHGWDTWDRLRATSVRTVEIIAGKAICPLMTSLAQLVILFSLGAVLFDFRLTGSLLGLGLVAASLSLCLVAAGVALAAVCKTMMQLNAIANLGGLVIAGLGGALTPVEALPGWARAIAPCSPAYWALRGFRSVVLEHGSVSDVVGSTAVLLAFAVGFVLVGLFRFRVDQEKVSWV